ncbi:hypothetical protein Ae201684P_012058 [Aphanomyces euteiches]|uniref:Impact N-terminal domain-containing protein n=1 Tax=Aphanomyces euteiches TaxID=100861 RepID=A0A6G0WJ67_9STRA|nr:hypothetical protein Ae201684_014545 [Aphanomyces euteiches]KAH9081085.1 hypothetical protein Ae201684P_012058 [Aphanomyces euteiches]
MRIKTIVNAVEAELLPKIKGSRFIGFAGPVSSREEALQLVASRRALIPQANHHCFAYTLATTNESFCSDDGEPHSTAGRPILQVLTHHQVQDVCLIVSRIFGGTKLGTGGLVRAYGSAAEHTIAQAQILETEVTSPCVISIPIRFTEIVKKWLHSHEGVVTAVQFESTTVEMSVKVPLIHEAKFEKYVNELSGGRASISKPANDR